MHLSMARDSLARMLDDEHVPGEIRNELASEYANLQALLDKVENNEIHIAVLGRVSVGKSSLLNALIGSKVFSTSPLHGETRSVGREPWQSYDSGGVFLIDTPGLDEIDGKQRETLAIEAAAQSDLVLFVVDGDLTTSELDSLRTLKKQACVILLVLNKTDRLAAEEKTELLSALERRTSSLIDPDNILWACASPSPRVVIEIDGAGVETETLRESEPDVTMLTNRLWEIIEQDGRSLAALNASLFASHVSDRVSKKIMETRRDLAEKTIRYYCIAKGISVALNPIPVADLAAAAAIDSALVYHLSRVYDLPMSRRESGKLVALIVTQLAVLMGAVWALHLASSLLKLGSAGLSTVLTASTQGAVAYYSTYLVGQITERYLEQGKSWGKSGPKNVIQEIMASIDRESIIHDARDDIMHRLTARKTSLT